jgi:hypothetical protein
VEAQIRSTSANFEKMEAPHIWYLQLFSLSLLFSLHQMFLRYTPWSKLQRTKSLQIWLTTKAQVAAMATGTAVTGSASLKIAVAGGEAEAVDPFSTAAVRIRREIWGVRNISKLDAVPQLRISD